jgi:hypothetical protein
LQENVVDNPWGVLGLMFFAVGALGLPVLWRSRAFSWPSKVGLSLVVTLYSGAMLAAVVWVIWKAALLFAPLFGG